MIAAQTRQNNAKLGFYPTDSLTLKAITDSIEFKDKVTMLDPCCGEGVALETISKGQHRTIGVELNEDRYLEARAVLDICINSDSMNQINYTPSKLDFLFLNPPYGYSSTFKRLEYGFVKRYSQSLATGGVIALLVPSTQVNPDFLKYLLSNFELECAGLAHEQQYSQWLFIGKKIRRRVPNALIIKQTLETIGINFEIPIVATICKASINDFKITTSAITQTQVIHAIDDKPNLWGAFFESHIVSRDIPNEQPLIEPTDWFITLGILGGHISGFLENDNEKVLLRGKVHKQLDKPKYGEGGNYTQTEIFVPKILAINVKKDSEEFGDIYEIK